MNTASLSQSDRWMDWMAGLADSSRLRLLRLLEAQELGVAELCDVLQMPQSTVSRHLKVLGQQGWSVSRRAGTNNLYRMVLDELEPAARDLWLMTRTRMADWPTARQDDARLRRYMASRRQDTREFFAGLAGEWTTTRASLYGNRFNLDTLAALLPSDAVVADLGCGSGQFAAPLSRHVARVIGVDNSPEMLAAAARHREPRLELHEADLTDLPIESASCDAALMVIVLTYVEHPQPILAEMRRILKPGGRAVIVDLLRHDRDDFRRQMGQQSMGYAEDELAALLIDAGFADPRVQVLPPEEGAQGPALTLATASPN